MAPRLDPIAVKNSCGKVRPVRVTRLYFNHDPLPNDPIFAH